jgi:hypothetical protein
VAKYTFKKSVAKYTFKKSVAKYTQPFLSKQIIKGSNEVDLAKNRQSFFKQSKLKKVQTK